ncbi:MAG: hypothetical protein RL481_1626 [Pseudomonadota bacterium]|jgi:hypothetical protein
MSVTAVPILPIEKGSLLKLWGGVALAVLVAGGLAWAGTTSGSCGDKAFLDVTGDVKDVETTSSGLKIQTVKAGKGAKATEADVALVNYRGSLASNGEVFDENRQTPFPVKGMIPGFTEALQMMQPGGSYRLCIPGNLAYGARGTPDGRIPANATLLFEVDLIAHMPEDQYRAAMQAMQAQQQGGGAGAPPAGGGR